MKMVKTLVAFLLCTSILISGCSKKENGGGSPEAKGSVPKVSETTTIESIKNALPKLDIKQLESAAEDYKELISAKNADLTDIMDKITKIPLAEKLGEEAKSLKSELDVITESISSLTERLNLYVDQIKANGGDIANYDIK